MSSRAPEPPDSTPTHQALATSVCFLLPDWIVALKPDRATPTDESVCCVWIDRDILLDVYEDGEVVAMAPCEDGKRGYCEVVLTDREWIENFVAHGWSDTNPTFTKNIPDDAPR